MSNLVIKEKFTAWSREKFFLETCNKWRAYLNFLAFIATKIPPGCLVFDRSHCPHERRQ